MALIRLFFLLHESLIGRPLYYRDSVRVVNKACIHYVKRRACTEDETIRVCSRPTHPSRNSRWDKRVKTKMRKLSCHLRLSVACLITRPVDIYICVLDLFLPHPLLFRSRHASFGLPDLLWIFAHACSILSLLIRGIHVAITVFFTGYFP